MQAKVFHKFHVKNIDCNTAVLSKLQNFISLQWFILDLLLPLRGTQQRTRTIYNSKFIAIFVRL